MKDKILKNTPHGVFEEGSIVKLQVGNFVLPWTWDAAIRCGVKLRVHLRDAKEYIGMSRALALNHRENEPLTKISVHENKTIMEGEYRVYADGPDVVLDIRGGVLTMIPEVAENISPWMIASGTRIQEKYFPDMKLFPHVAYLTDGVATEKLAQSRRDSTAIFVP